MAKLTSEARNRLKSSDFALPGERRYPIENESHARAALSMVARYGSPEEQAKVRSAVKRRYPEIS